MKAQAKPSWSWGGCAAAVVRVRTGMACVLCWSSSLVGAGSSVRAGPSLVCWLLILISAGYSEPGAPSPGVAGFVFARISATLWPLRQAATTCVLGCTNACNDNGDIIRYGDKFHAASGGNFEPRTLCNSEASRLALAGGGGQRQGWLLARRRRRRQLGGWRSCLQR